MPNHPTPKKDPLKPSILANPLKTKADALALVRAMAFNDAMLKTAAARLADEVATARANHDADIALTLETITKQREALQAWSEANKQEYFSEPRSIETINGVFGFRKSKSLQLFSRLKWADVVDRLATPAFTRALLVLQRLTKYLRITIEVDKRAMLAAATAEKPMLSAKKLSSYGVKLEVWDEFYVELKTN